jgi:hypothetical protein
MSDDSALNRYLGGRGGRSGSHDISEIEEMEGSTFGRIRGMRDRAIMLELRRKTGQIKAISYSAIFRIEFDPSEGITIFHGRDVIKVRGQHLNSQKDRRGLFEAITRNLVPWVQETSQSAALQADKDACIIEAIEWG